MSSPEGRVYFATADYILMALMLGVSMAIGIGFAATGKNKGNNAEYLLGGRQFKALPVSLSLFASFMSAISLMGVPTEIYSYGTMWVYGIIGLMFSYVLAIYLLIPLIYPLKVTTVFEYLNLRFQSRNVQLFGAVLGVVNNVSYMTVALLTPALALETAVGIPLWLSIILVGAVGTVYTTVGGIKSVIWADVFQTFVIFFGIFTVLIKSTMDAGGYGKVWQVGWDSGRIILDDFRVDPRVRHTGWNMTFAITIYWMASHFSQSSVQRLVATRSIQDAKKVYIYTIPIMFVFNFVLCVTGLVIVAYFHEIGCDPLAAGYIQNSNQLVPYFVIHSLSFLPGLSGLYIATIFSGALSTLSSGINSLAANTVQDFLAWFLQHRSDFFVTSFTKCLVCLFGMIATGLAYLAQDLEGTVIRLSYTVIAATNGPLLGLYLLGGLCPQANYVGATVGLLSSLVVCCWQAVGSLRFGFTREKLPPGPTDSCIAGNITSVMTTEGYNFTKDGNYSVQSSFDTTTSSYVRNMQPMDAAILADRDFSFYDVSYVWAPVTGVIITFVVGLIVSLVSNVFLTKKVRPEARFLFQFCRRFWYSDMDVLGTEMRSPERPLGHE